jgi:hypothetical protein
MTYPSSRGKSSRQVRSVGVDYRRDFPVLREISFQPVSHWAENLELFDPAQTGFAAFGLGRVGVMNTALVVILVLVVAAIVLAVVSSSRASRNRTAASLADAKADARRVIERLGGQVLGVTGTDDASKQAMADASERYTAASSQIEQATSVKQAQLAKESALEGLYYVRAARQAMGMDVGPELESLAGQQSAGAVTEDRRVQIEGRELEASPAPSNRTPNYFPGGRVAGRPVPAGWYSEPWWKTALVAGAWGVGSVLVFDALFSGMDGVGYGASGFENGYGQGFDSGYDAGMDAGQGQDGGGWGGDFGGGDFGGGDFGGF